MESRERRIGPAARRGAPGELHKPRRGSWESAASGVRRPEPYPLPQAERGSVRTSQAPAGCSWESVVSGVRRPEPPPLPQAERGHGDRALHAGIPAPSARLPGRPRQSAAGRSPHPCRQAARCLPRGAGSALPGTMGGHRAPPVSPVSARRRGRRAARCASSRVAAHAAARLRCVPRAAARRRTRPAAHRRGARRGRTGGARAGHPGGGGRARRCPRGRRCSAPARRAGWCRRCRPGARAGDPPSRASDPGRRLSSCCSADASRPALMNPGICAAPATSAS